MQWQGGKIFLPDARISFSEFSATILIDEAYNNWKMLFKWITTINNNKDKYVEDFTNLLTDASLLVYDNWLNNVVLKLKLVNIWPIRCWWYSIDE